MWASAYFWYSVSPVRASIMIAACAWMAGACKGQTGPAPGGESATGERQSSALRTGRDVGSCVAQPARIRTPSAGTMHRFIAAEGPVYARVDQVESLHPGFSSREPACRFLPSSNRGRDDEGRPPCWRVTPAG